MTSSTNVAILVVKSIGTGKTKNPTAVENFNNINNLYTRASAVKKAAKSNKCHYYTL